MDRRPSLYELAQVAREALPLRPPPLGAARDVAVRAVVRAVALVLASVALPGVGFVGDGRPSWIDVALVTVLVGGVGTAWEPAWRRLVGPARLPTLAASVTVLDAALLRVVDVLVGPRFDTDDGLELLAAAAIVALPTAVLAVVRDVLAKPDSLSLPD